MIGSLRGKLLVKRPEEVLVETSDGVGYVVSVGTNTLAELDPEGSGVFLYIYTHVRDDILQLYGFSSEDEKRVFITLLGISGVGPKVALSVISSIPHDEFLSAVESEDVDFLIRVPGLGKKTANRIVLELKGKLPKLGPAAGGVFDDALSALVNLGYKKAEARAVVQKAYARGVRDLEALVRESLAHLTGADEVKGRGPRKG